MILYDVIRGILKKMQATGIKVNHERNSDIYYSNRRTEVVEKTIANFHDCLNPKIH